jgi:hypothetical protein
MKENKNLFKLELVPEAFVSGKTKFVLKGFHKKQKKESLIYDFSTEKDYP